MEDKVVMGDFNENLYFFNVLMINVEVWLLIVCRFFFDRKCNFY